MPDFFTALIVLFTSLTPLAAKAETLPILDTSTVNSVSISGQASDINFTTSANRPFNATISATRSDWFANWYSYWFSDRCATQTTAKIEGRALIIKVINGPDRVSFDCHVSIAINLPKDADISIDQTASRTELTGDFGAVRINSNAARIDFDGYATSLAIKGDAVHSNVRFSHSNSNETIALDAHAAKASFSFAKNTAVSYAVNAVASTVDSTLENTPGAKPFIRINSEFLDATIR